MNRTRIVTGLRCVFLTPMLCALLAVIFPALVGCAVDGGSISAGQLQCEYRENPEGIASVRPRFSWKLSARDSEARGLRQSAYRVTVARTADELNNPKKLIWDTGRVDGEAGARTSQIEYAGVSLVSRDRLWWRVNVWDQASHESRWSETASFSVGLVDETQWKAKWIGLDAEPSEPLTRAVREELRSRPWIRMAGEPERNERVAFFRKEFDLPETGRPGAVERAWMAGTADMIAEVSINGKSVGQLTRWDLVRPIEVGAALMPGRNAIGIRVEQHDGFNPAVTGMLVVRLGDGTERQILLDKAWKLSGASVAGWDRARFDESAWTAVEESRGQPWGGSRNTEHFMPPAPYLRTTFAPAPEKKIRRATLYATALGVYECRINGARVGSVEFAPGWTEYSKRVEHQTYDVTRMVKPGQNCLGAVLGDGWYAGLMGYTGTRRFYGGPARFMAQLEIEYGDGTRDTTATGPGWEAAFGPIVRTDNYMGSEYDSRLEMKGWDLATFDSSAWKKVDTGLAQVVRAREADVTAKVVAAMREGGVSILVGPGTLGDPAYGVVKTLRVEYSARGVKKSVSLREGETLLLPRAEDSGAIVVTRAVFGEPVPPPLPAFMIEPQSGESVKRFEELPAIAVSEPRKGRYVFDLGQNMVGWARVRVIGVSGQRLVVRHAEMLNPDKTLYTSNLRGATATDFYTLKGGAETLEPPFTFHGFRYVEITGLTATPELSMVTGIVVHTAMKPVGTFATSSPLVNQLVHNIVWGQKGNYLEVPTDCPQRDERLGWTGDAQFFVNTAAYTFDIAAFMQRWLKTLNQDSQFEDGTYAHVSPKVAERGGSTAWGDAAIVCTHAMYTSYGDTRVISDNYDAMNRYMAWLDTRTSDEIAKVGGFGDWLNLGDPTAPDLIDTAYRANLLRIMSEMAAAIGKSADAARFDAAHTATVAAFQARFVNADGSLQESGQTGYALAFTMRLFPEELREKAGEHFARAIAAKNNHLATGFIGTPRLLPGLYAAGQAPVAARLLMNDDYPSWLYQVKLGATTMWERWDGWTPEKGFSDVGMNSFNHYAFGSVGDYLYRHVAGISPAAPGYSRVRVAPTLTAGLDHAAATYDSIAGTIASSWRRTQDGVEYDITIPPNVSAEIRLPGELGSVVTEGGRAIGDVRELVLVPASGDAARVVVGSGVYRFVVTTLATR